jgi:glycosyltransferase involved in cell wall biosynthesis
MATRPEPVAASSIDGWRAPTVSLGVPVYNGERYLEDALTSARDQTFNDLEVVICDNASTDNTQQIALRFVAEDPRFRYVRNEENIGVILNWRRTFELSTGRYFKWLSSDDVLDVKYVERCVGAMESRPESSLCACLMPPIDESGNLLPFDEETGDWVSRSGERYRVWAAPDGLSSDDPARRFDDVVHNLPGNMQGQFSYGLMRSALLRAMPPHGFYLGAERVLQAQLALAGPWIYIDEPLTFRRIHADHLGAGKVRDVIAGLDPGWSGGFTLPALNQLRG